MQELFSLDGDSVPAGARVVGVSGSEAISQPFRHELWLDLPAGADPDLEGLLGTRASLHVHDADGVARDTIHGVLRVAEWVEGDLLRVELVPAIWLLSLGRHSRVWVDKAFPEILDEVLRGAGLGDSDFSARLNGRYAPLAHVCQYRESDLAFVQRWCEQLGIRWYFEHDGAREKAVFVDAAQHPESSTAHVRYVAAEGDDTSGLESLRTFSLRRVASAVTVRVADYTAAQPSLAVDASQTAPFPGEGTMVWMFEDDVANPTVARQAAKLRVEQLQSEYELHRGTGRVFGLHPGFRFTLEEHPRGALNQSYLVTDVEVRGANIAREEGTPELRARIGDAPWQVEVRAVRAEVPFRPPRVTPVPHVDGVVLGHVDGPVDSEYAQIDDQGRYVVKLRLDERTHREGEWSTRVRMMQPHAGAPEGFHFPLRKGTAVLVVFVGGDPDRPMLAASMPDADTPSPVTSANHTQNVIHTGGNSRFEIEDQAGAQYVDISTPPQHTFVHLGTHHASHQHNSIASTDGNGLIHQGSNQDIMVDSNKTEDVTHEVDEKYDQTQRTVTIGNVTETYHATQTTTVTGLCEEQYESHTTNVTAHKIEQCATQDTGVSNLLDEHHGSQSTTVGGLLLETCATREFTASTQSAQFYDNLTWNVGGGGFTVNDDSYLFINAPNYTVMVPQVTEVQNVHTEAAPSDWKIYEPTKTSRDTAKVSIIAGTVSAIGYKTDKIGLAIGYTPSKTALIGAKFDMSGVKVEQDSVKQCGGPFYKGEWALKVWL